MTHTITNGCGRHSRRQRNQTLYIAHSPSSTMNFSSMTATRCGLNVEVELILWILLFFGWKSTPCREFLKYPHTSHAAYLEENRTLACENRYPFNRFLTLLQTTAVVAAYLHSDEKTHKSQGNSECWWHVGKFNVEDTATPSFCYSRWRRSPSTQKSMFSIIISKSDFHFIKLLTPWTRVEDEVCCFLSTIIYTRNWLSSQAKKFSLNRFFSIL